MEIEGPRARMGSRRSVLDDLGEEVTGIISPVSICMVLTVVLVRILNPDGESSAGAVSIASAYYDEDEADSTSQKLTGAVINAVIFVSVVAFMTFVLVLLFKYGCTKIIYGYMGFAAFSIFFVLTGIIVLELLQKANIHLDWISFTYMLYNFSMVGAVTLFFTPAPLFMKQSYLIITGVAVAFVFTWVPEWTTWILLLAMALYDVIAVLVPGGPLKVLVELAEERDEDIPALVYQARPTRRDDNLDERVMAFTRQQQQQQEMAAAAAGAASLETPTAALATAAPGDVSIPEEDKSSNGSDSQVLQEAPDTPLIPPTTTQSSAAEVFNPRDDAVENGIDLEQRYSHSSMHYSSGQQEVESDQTSESEQSAAFPDAIRLGLGDFIFYSVLVGRAAMYDMLTVFACYIAIIAGLGCTLLWLAFAHKALPALPISIALAVAFYFISRFVMEPVVLPMVLQLVYF